MNQQEQVVTIPYIPRPQLRHIHPELDKCDEACLVLHRRAGKTVLLLNHIIKRALQFPRDDGEFAYIAPFLKQAKRIAWKYLKRFCDPIPGRQFSESELSVTLPNGSRIGLYGADNPEALRGIYLDGAVLDEYAQIDPDVYESILSPALMDREGWVVFSGTPDGKNHFYHKLKELRADPNAYTLILGASQSGILTPSQLEKARKRAGSQEKYDREYECSFDSVGGKKIYTEFRYATHVSPTSLKPTTPVEVIRGWDNTGLSPAVVLTYITPTGQWRVFKEFVFQDCDIRDATEGVIMWCNQHLPPGTRYRDYCDPAGKSRDTTKMSPRDYIILKSRELGQDIWLVDGIQTPDVRWASVSGRLTRIYNGEPAILIDPSCEVLIEGFAGAYAYQEMAGNPGVYLKKAIKNLHSNIHDALQYPATRLFVSNDNLKSGSDGFLNDGHGWDDEDTFFDDGNRAAGKSQYTGY